MEVNIRPYQIADLDSVVASWEAATRLAHTFMSDEFIVQERINVADVYLPNTDTWVADLNGDVVGFISLMENEVGALFLQPVCHGRGIGRALMDKARAIHGDLEVEVFQKNSVGRNFYTKYGFTFLQEKIHEPINEVLYRLRYSKINQ